MQFPLFQHWFGDATCKLAARELALTLKIILQGGNTMCLHEYMKIFRFFGFFGPTCKLFSCDLSNEGVGLQIELCHFIFGRIRGHEG